MKRILGGVLAVVLLSAAPAFADNGRSRDGENTTTVARQSNKMRYVAMAIGAGAGVGLGLLVGKRMYPNAGCADGKVMTIGAVFGAGGAFAGYAFARSAADPFAALGSPVDRLALTLDDLPLLPKFGRPGKS